MLAIVSVVQQTMGNLWTSPQVRPVHGTYLEDRPRRPLHQKVSSILPKVEAPPRPPTEVLPSLIPAKKPPPPYKEKALRIFHDVALRRRAFIQGTLIQRRE
jgi:hypothetical protein